MSPTGRLTSSHDNLSHRLTLSISPSDFRVVYSTLDTHLNWTYIFFRFTLFYLLESRVTYIITI